MKKIIALLLAVLLLGLSVPAYAEDASPWYIHILHMSDNFYISTSGTATVFSDMATRSGSYCTIAAKVQRETTSGWSTVVTFRATGDNYALIEETTKLSKGYTYKCVYTFTVYDEYDMIVEQESFTSQEIEYK